VSDVLEYLAAGMSEDEILAKFPDLEREDIRAALAFAADRERRCPCPRPEALKLLFDQNVAPRLARTLADLIPGSAAPEKPGASGSEPGSERGNELRYSG
jgi:hypothetical protein